VATLIFALNVAVAVLLGLAIGLERQWRQHAAGLRTNALVSLGAAMFVGLATMIDDDASPTRIAAQVVSGLGFLGGGVILREGLNVRGLNTAATLWCSGAVGTLSGSGYPLEASVGALFVLVVHLALRPIVYHIEQHKRKSGSSVETFYRLQVECDAEHDGHIRNVLLRHVSGNDRLSLQGLATEDNDQRLTTVVADIFCNDRNDRDLEEVVARISIEPEVRAVRWLRA
jgi:putative Mg2+ transporter-C (MgtC) family protein